MPPLYVAFDPERAELSDIPHRNLRALFEKGDAQVVRAMQTYRQLTDAGRIAIMKSDWEELGRIVNANYELRRTIMNIAPENQRMIDVAREAGASAKFAGSGGAVVGVCKDGAPYQE